MLPVWSLLAATALAGAGDAQDALRVINTSTTSGYVRIADAAVLEPQTFTIESWFTPLGPGRGRTNDNIGATIIDKADEGAIGPHLGSYAIRWAPNTQLVNVRLVNRRGAAGIFLFGNTRVPIGTTTHVAFTFDGQTARLHINGVLDAQMDPGFSTLYYGPEDVLIGAANFGGGFERRLDGKVDEVRIWDKAFDAGTLASRMHCRLTGSEANLIGYWSFDGQNLNDRTANGNNGVAVGAGVTYDLEDTAFVGCPNGPRLSVDTASISLATGGVQNLALDAGAGLAGKQYIVLGSISGVLPGFVYTGVTVPLNIDPYTQLSLSIPGVPPFLNTFGNLDGQGRAAAAIAFPPLPGLFDGLTFHHDFVVLDPNRLLYVGNPAPLTLVR